MIFAHVQGVHTRIYDLVRNPKPNKAEDSGLFFSIKCPRDIKASQVFECVARAEANALDAKGKVV